MLKISNLYSTNLLRRSSSIFFKLHDLKHYTTQLNVFDRNNSECQSLHISQPNRDDLYQISKDISITVQFWTKYVKDKEKTFVIPSWLPRNSNTIQVEKSVFITKQNLLNLMWENGFQTEEITLFENTFPHQYEFHAPELALLFNCTVEDCYKFCLKTQTRDSFETLLVNQKKNSPSLKLGLYGLLSSCLWFATQTNMLGNAWTMTKTWPFFAVLYMLALRFKGSITNVLNGYKLKEGTIAKKNKTDGEQALYMQVQKLKKDQELLEQVNKLCVDTEKMRKDYQKALLVQHLKTMTWTMTRHLHAIRRDQNSLFVTIQKSIVENVVQAFSNDIVNNKKLYQSLLKQSIQAITEKEKPLERMLKFHLNKKLKEIQDNELDQTFLRHIQDNFQKEYQAFLQKYTVREDEGNILKQLANRALVSKNPLQLNLSHLSKEEYETLQKLRASILERLGLKYCITYDLVDNEPDTFNPVVRDLTVAAQHSMQQWQNDLDKKALKHFLISFL